MNKVNLARRQPEFSRIGVAVTYVRLRFVKLTRYQSVSGILSATGSRVSNHAMTEMSARERSAFVEDWFPFFL